MSSFHKRLANTLAVLPVIILVTFTNVLIASVMAGATFLQLLTVLNWSKSSSLVVAILVAVAVYLYIIFQPKIRNYINVRS